MLPPATGYAHASPLSETAWRHSLCVENRKRGAICQIRFATSGMRSCPSLPKNLMKWLMPQANSQRWLQGHRWWNHSNQPHTFTALPADGDVLIMRTWSCDCRALAPGCVGRAYKGKVKSEPELECWARWRFSSVRTFSRCIRVKSSSALFSELRRARANCLKALSHSRIRRAQSAHSCIA